MTESFPRDTQDNPPPIENPDAITNQLHQMSLNLWRISKARQLPPREHPYFQEAVEKYRAEPLWGSSAEEVKEVVIAHGKEATSHPFIDKESGLQVLPRFIHPYGEANPDSLALRFSVPRRVHERSVDKIAEWLAKHHDAKTAEDRTRNLYNIYARERRLTYMHGNTGPVTMEIIRPGRESSPQLVPIGPSLGAFMHGLPGKTNSPQLLIGPIHYNTYNGPPEDHGIHGHSYDLPAKDLAMFASVLERAVSHLVRLDDVTAEG